MRHGTKSQDYKDKIIEEGERIAQIIQDLEAERLKTIGGGTNDDQLGKGRIGNGEKEE